MNQQAQAPIDRSNAEHRRYKRYPVRIDAVFKAQGMQPLACEIQDFCEGGLLMKPGDDNKNNIALDGLKNQTITVEFSSDYNQQEKPFQLDATVVWVSGSRLGAAFLKTPPEPTILEALFHAAQSAKNSSSATIIPKPTPSKDITALKTRWVDLASNSIRKIIGDFYQNIDTELTESALQSGSDAFGNAFLEAIPQLTSMRANLEEKILCAVTGRFSENGQTPDTEPEKAPTALSLNNLSLVDQNEFEDWLNISEVITRTRKLFANELVDLKEKISYLTNYAFDDTSNPIGPDYICETFREGIEQNGFDPDIRKAIYKVFESALNSNLAELYKTLLDISGDLVPQSNTTIKAEVNEPQHQISPGPSTNSPQTQPEPVTQTGNDTADKLNQSSAAAQFQPIQMPNIENSLQSFSEIANKLIELENQRCNPSAQQQHQSKTEGQDSGTTTVGSTSDYSPEQILNTIASLRQSKQSESHLTPDNQRIESDIQEFLASGSLAGSIPNPEQQQAIRVAGKFFDGVSTETYGSPGMEAIMQKLQLPLLKLALEDNQFLNSNDHPVRKILNSLDQISGAANVKGEILNSQTQNVLQEIMEQFVNNTQHKPEIFVELGKKLDRVAQPVEKSRLQNIRRVQESSEGKQKTLRARQKIEQLIDSRIADKNVPKVIVELLNAGWKHLLVLYEIKEGADSKSLNKAIDVIDKLLTWMDASQQPDNVNNPGIQEVLNYVDSELSSVCTDVGKHYGIMQELVACLIGQGDPKVRKQPAMTLIPKATSDQNNIEEENAANPMTMEWFDQIGQLKVGDWLLFILKDERKEPLNLVWKSDVPSSYVFVNRKGIKRFELTSHKLAELMRQGLAIQIEGPDVPLSDRAANHMLQEMHEKLVQHATHDQQTGLINRKEFVKQLEYELVKTKQYKSTHTLCYIDIDQITLIINSCAIEAGELLLKQLVQLLSEQLTGEYTLSRMGDETFAVLLKNTSHEDAAIIAENLRSSIGGFEFNWNDKDYSMGVSIGLVGITENSEIVISILKHADTACLSAKESGGNRISVYQENDEELQRQDDIFEWAGRISKVLSENRIVLRCQLISPVCGKKSSHSHYEILLCVKDEQGQIIPPDSFIPSVESCNRMPEVDQWVVRNATKWIENNRAKFDRMGGFSINLSGQSVNSEEFLNFLKTELPIRDIPLQKITFEITETAAMHNLSFAQKFITQIKRYGCKFSLDDFGSGFSSYSYLKHLDVDYLKIDGVFVKDLATSQTDYVMVKSMNEIGHSLGKETIAEYVEDEHILQKLNEIGVDYAQGFGIEKPIFLSELEL